MSNPFRPLSQPSSNSPLQSVLSPGSPAYLDDEELALEEVSETPKAGGETSSGWKFWERAGKKKELETLKTQHEELVGMMKELCQTMAKAPAAKQERARASGSFPAIAPMPAQNFDQFADTQREVGGALGRLNGHLELVDGNQGRFVDSMDRVGETMTAVRASNDNAMQSMDKLRRAATAVTDHVDRSADRFEKLHERMQEAEKGLVESFAKMQKQSFLISAGLAVLLILCLVALGFVIAAS